MKITESRTVTKTFTDDVMIGIECDCCKKQFLSSSGNVVYYHVATHHDDWGNDSIESYEHFDFCSCSCLQKHQEEYFCRANGSEQYDIARRTLSYRRNKKDV